MGTSKSGLTKRAGLLAMTLVLGACGPEPASQGPDGCAPSGENLIHDTSFATLFAHHSKRQWQSSEHAAGETFEPTVEEGTLSIRKIGNEPWFLVTQGTDTGKLAGKTLAFSAELKFDLHEPRDPHGFGYGGGLSIMAKRGAKVVVNSSMDHQPNFGVHDWQPVEVVFQLPKKSSYLQLGFVHQAGGTLEVRNPALYVVNPDCPLTATKKKQPPQPGRPSDLGRLSTGQ